MGCGMKDVPLADKLKDDNANENCRLSIAQALGVVHLCSSKLGLFSGRDCRNRGTAMSLAASNRHSRCRYNMKNTLVHELCHGLMVSKKGR
ncbi:hypothetical protein L1887_05993 [Cichorium endivia]|nr:hypothetical protein L1887_05993 [Cichorium endivia]